MMLRWLRRGQGRYDGEIVLGDCVWRRLVSTPMSLSAMKVDPVVALRYG
jgi:hypothetical protein